MVARMTEAIDIRRPVRCLSLGGLRLSVSVVALFALVAVVGTVQAQPAAPVTGVLALDASANVELPLDTLAITLSAVRSATTVTACATCASVAQPPERIRP